MVVLNGIKYACERCIRGHRVSTCNHTDQPLTMIKPKGRPSTQCQHCRDQRKLKNLHINCACQKKGKSPGQHLGSCYKNPNGCTCYQNHKLKALDKSKKTKPIEGDVLSNSLSDSSQSNSNSLANSNSNSNINLANHANPNPNNMKVESHDPDLNLDVDDYLIENSMKNLKSDGQGLFGFFNNEVANSDLNGTGLMSNDSKDNHDFDPRVRNMSNSPSSIPFNHTSNESLIRESSDPVSDDFKKFISDPRAEVSGFSSPLKKEQDIHNGNLGSITGTTGFDNQEVKSDPDEIDINENYFPLFPLVGNQSFETSESMPLTSIPSNYQSSISRSHSNSFRRNSNRPESVLSINSNSSISTDFGKMDHSAYPPSSAAQSLPLNQSQSNLSNSSINQSQQLSHTQTLTANNKNSFGNIMETNELYVSDEDLEHFLNDFNESDYNDGTSAMNFNNTINNMNGNNGENNNRATES